MPESPDVIDQTLAKLLTLAQCTEGCPDMRFDPEARAVLEGFTATLLEDSRTRAGAVFTQCRADLIAEGKARNVPALDHIEAEVLAALG
jgi:hypothetical protein